MAAEKVDGTDFFAVHAAMDRAIQRAHRGEGPTAIECMAKRWRGHFEGDPQNYRDKTELALLSKTSDPLVIFRERVIGDQTLTAVELDAIDADVANLIADAVEAALAAPQPHPRELLTDVYLSY